jgi:hypothetical protein
MTTLQPTKTHTIPLTCSRCGKVHAYLSGYYNARLMYCECMSDDERRYLGVGGGDTAAQR